MPCPRAAIPGSFGAAQEFASAVGYPLIAKLTTPWARQRASQHFGRRRSAGTRARSTERCDQSGAGLMLQEFIPGGQGHDWFFHGYCDANSVCQPAFTGSRTGPIRPAAGLTSLGRRWPNEKLRDRDHLAACPAWSIADCSTSISAWTPGTGSTTCWISIRGWARSSVSSATPRVLTLPLPPTST